MDHQGGLVIVNSGFTKALIGTDYNNRVDECRIALSLLEKVARGKTTPYKDIKLQEISRQKWLRFISAKNIIGFKPGTDYMQPG
ncbi:MAG: hypothetical protein RBT73_11600 [Spirochaetia bacterium]|nr:hypothetical protein [Spirochaetia bacterium]